MKFIKDTYKMMKFNRSCELVFGDIMSGKTRYISALIKRDLKSKRKVYFLDYDIITEEKLTSFSGFPDLNSSLRNAERTTLVIENTKQLDDSIMSFIFQALKSSTDINIMVSCLDTEYSVSKHNYAKALMEESTLRETRTLYGSSTGLMVSMDKAAGYNTAVDTNIDLSKTILTRLNDGSFKKLKTSKIKYYNNKKPLLEKLFGCNDSDKVVLEAG